MTLLEQVHQKYIYTRRIRVLAQHLSEVLPAHANVLDVGCGDGLLAHTIMKMREEIHISGVEVLVREKAYVPVTRYDGAVLPFDDSSFDVVMFVDVLHHAADPMVLLREAARVTRQSIVIKDHDSAGFLAVRTLRFMDNVGNARYGVSLPYNYWTGEQWQDAFEGLRLVTREQKKRLKLYPWPASMVFDRSLHFIARVERSQSNELAEKSHL